ncbi:MAG: outer membrane lipoprotein carrier protein LolA [Planctomycetota bacterium]
MNNHKPTLFFPVTIIAFFIITAIFSGNVARGKDIDDILTGIETANSSFKTMKADITFTRTITLLESTETSQGELSYKKPQKLYLKFYPPKNEVNIVDGKYVWVYHPNEKQVEKYEMSKGKQSSQSMSFFEFGYGESVGDAKKNYEITLIDTKGEEPKQVYTLNLKPKDPKSQYSGIKLWIEDGFWLPHKIELGESGGEVVNTIELKNIKLNKGMSDKVFTFDVPRNVEIIEPFK